MGTQMRRPSIVVSDPGIMGGTPVVFGTRVPADTVLAEVLAGTTRYDIFCHYPSLPPDGIDACLAWERSGKPVVAPLDRG